TKKWDGHSGEPGSARHTSFRAGLARWIVSGRVDRTVIEVLTGKAIDPAPHAEGLVKSGRLAPHCRHRFLEESPQILLATWRAERGQVGAVLGVNGEICEEGRHPDRCRVVVECAHFFYQFPEGISGPPHRVAPSPCGNGESRGDAYHGGIRV